MAISYVCAKCGARMNADQPLVRDMLCPVCRVPMHREDVVAAVAPAPVPATVAPAPVMGVDKPRPAGLKVARIVAPPPGGRVTPPTGSAATGKFKVAATVLDTVGRMTDTAQRIRLQAQGTPVSVAPVVSGTTDAAAQEVLLQAREQADHLVTQAKAEAAALLVQAQQTAAATGKKAQEQAVQAAAEAKAAAEKVVAAAQAAVDQGLAAAQAEAAKITTEAQVAADKMTAEATAAAAIAKEEAGRQKVAADKMIADAQAAADKVTAAAVSAAEKMAAEAKTAAAQRLAEARKSSGDQSAPVTAVVSPAAEAKTSEVKAEVAKPASESPKVEVAREIANRQAEVTKAVKREANLLMGGIIGSAVTALYLVFILARMHPSVPLKFISWLMLIADTGAFAFLVAIIWGHYSAGTKAVAKHKERMAGPTPATPGAQGKAVGPAKTAAPAGKPGAFKMPPPKKPFIMAKPKTATPPPAGVDAQEKSDANAGDGAKKSALAPVSPAAAPEKADGKDGKNGTEGKKPAPAGGNAADVQASAPKPADAKAAKPSP